MAQQEFSKRRWNGAVRIVVRVVLKQKAALCITIHVFPFGVNAKFHYRHSVGCRCICCLFLRQLGRTQLTESIQDASQAILPATCRAYHTDSCRYADSSFHVRAFANPIAGDSAESCCTARDSAGNCQSISGHGRRDSGSQQSQQRTDPPRSTVNHPQNYSGTSQ